MRRNYKQCTVFVELKTDCTMRQLLQEARDAGVAFSNVQMEHQENGVVSLIATVKSCEKAVKKRTGLLEILRNLSSVAYYEEL